MILDKHTHRANALAAMRAAVACDWAKIIMGAEMQKQQEGSETRAEYYAGCQQLNLQVEDELSKCYEALAGYYAK